MRSLSYYDNGTDYQVTRDCTCDQLCRFRVIIGRNQKQKSRQIPDKDFVGRYGGDEFMAVIYHTGKTEIEELLQSLCREKDRLNSNEAQIPINYARSVI